MLEGKSFKESSNMKMLATCRHFCYVCSIEKTQDKTGVQLWTRFIAHDRQQPTDTTRHEIVLYAPKDTVPEST